MLGPRNFTSGHEMSVRTKALWGPRVGSECCPSRARWPWCWRPQARAVQGGGYSPAQACGHLSAHSESHAPLRISAKCSNFANHFKCSSIYLLGVHSLIHSPICALKQAYIEGLYVPRLWGSIQWKIWSLPWRNPQGLQVERQQENAISNEHRLGYSV